jgi:hypothetical protein
MAPIIERRALGFIGSTTSGPLCFDGVKVKCDPLALGPLDQITETCRASCESEWRGYRTHSRQVHHRLGLVAGIRPETIEKMPPSRPTSSAVKESLRPHWLMRFSLDPR